jgi:hypothetical protein
VSACTIDAPISFATADRGSALFVQQDEHRISRSLCVLTSSVDNRSIASWMEIASSQPMAGGVLIFVSYFLVTGM